MGTRADFYVGVGEKAEWLGSIAWDGYPSGIGPGIFKCHTEEAWRKAVQRFIAGRDDGTLPKDGWPWPWEDSRTTDYAYAFTPDGVAASCFGHCWFDPLKDEDCPRHSQEKDDECPKSAVFPNMKAVQSVTLGKRSGIIVIGPKPRAR